MRLMTRLFCASLVIALSYLMVGCGGGETSGTPGTEGNWNPQFGLIGGFYCTESEENVASNPDVDGFFRPDIDCNPDTPAIEYEFFGDHRLRVEIFNVDIPGRPGSARTVTISKIQIEYRRPQGFVPGAPVLQSRTIFQTVSIPPVTQEEALDRANATVFFTDLVSIATKDEFRQQFESGQRVPPDFPTEYEAVVTLFGSNVFDENLTVTFVVPFSIGDFDYCVCTQ